jgi:major intracellular serine protease
MNFTTTGDVTIYDGPPGKNQRKKGSINRGFTIVLNEAPEYKGWFIDANGDYFDESQFIAPPAALPAASVNSQCWAYEELKVEQFWAKTGSKGEGITIAVFDTGIDSTHVCFKGRNFLGRRFYSGGEDDCISDKEGHGTGVTSLIAGLEPSFVGVAPESTIIIAKIEKDFGINDLYAKAFAWAIKQKANIISISQEIASRDEALQRAIYAATEAGIFVVAAAGNTGVLEKNYIIYPACYENVLSIGAMGESRIPYIYSPRSDKLALVAPGDDIKIAVPGSTYKSDSGTSFAAPLVSACLAILLAASRKNALDVSRKKIEGAIKSTAREVKNYSSNQVGAGYLDPIAAFDFLVKNVSTRS